MRWYEVAFEARSIEIQTAPKLPFVLLFKCLIEQSFFSPTRSYRSLCAYIRKNGFNRCFLCRSIFASDVLPLDCGFYGRIEPDSGSDRVATTIWPGGCWFQIQMCRRRTVHSSFLIDEVLRGCGGCERRFNHIQDHRNGAINEWCADRVSGACRHLLGVNELFGLLKFHLRFFRDHIWCCWSEAVKISIFSSA